MNGVQNQSYKLVTPEIKLPTRKFRTGILRFDAEDTLLCPYCGRNAVAEGRRPGGGLCWVPLDTFPQIKISWDYRVLPTSVAAQNLFVVNCGRLRRLRANFELPLARHYLTNVRTGNR